MYCRFDINNHLIDRDDVLSDLRNQIIKVKISAGKFVVFDYEAGLGKTDCYCKALADLFLSGDLRKTLIVIKKIDEGKRVEGMINNIAKSNIAFAANCESGLGGIESFRIYNKNQTDLLKTYTVAIITQVTYLVLCKNHELAEEVFGDREIMILDEETEFVDSYKISLTDITNIESYLSKYDINPELLSLLVSNIKESMAQYSSQMKKVSIKADNEQFAYNSAKLLLSIDENAEKNKEYCENRKLLLKILSFVNDPNVIKYGLLLYSYDSCIKPFMLQNSMILDASASITNKYALAPNLFEVKQSKRHIQYTSCKLLANSDYRSTSSGKKQYIDFEIDLFLNIQNNIKNGDKILVLDNYEKGELMKELIETDKRFKKLKYMKLSKEFDIINYYAMRGKNDWAYFNKCYCIQQPQLEFPLYVFQREYYSGCKLSDYEMYFGKGGFLKCPDLELLRQTSQVATLYQAFRRIQRNLSPEGEFYLILKNENMIDLLIQQFQGIEYLKYDIEIRKKKQKKNTVANEIMEYLDNTERNSIVLIGKLADQCKTTENNILKTFTRHKELDVLRKAKNIILLNQNVYVEKLISMKPNEKILREEIAMISGVSWDNMIRRKDFITVCEHLHLEIVEGIIKHRD
jgi:hypothetical protein